MIPFRTQVKFFLQNPDVVDLSLFMGVFQRWIQQNALSELLIDVADYRHVFQGPGIMLIGHASDYAIENQSGRLGLLYTRKRQFEADFQTQLLTSFRLALSACDLLEREPAFAPGLKFRADEIEIRFPDRLQLPNRPETFEIVKGDLEAVVTNLYGTTAVHLSPINHDKRQLFTVGCYREGITHIGDLFPHLQADLEG